MRSRKCSKDFFSQPVEELVIGNVRCELAFLAVKKKKINIGTVIQLAAAEFTQCENGKLSRGRPVAVPQFAVPVFKYPTDANLRDLGKLAGCLFKRRDICKFAKRNARHLSAFPETKRCEILCCHRIARQNV